MWMTWPFIRIHLNNNIISLCHFENYLADIKESGLTLGLTKCSLTLGLSKCSFAKSEIKFVGQIIRSGIRLGTYFFEPIESFLPIGSELS